MNIPSAQLVALLLGLFAIGVVVGTLSYCLIMLADEMVQTLFLVLSFVAAAFSILFAYPAAIGAIVLICVISIYPAVLERRMDDKYSEWLACFIRLVMAAYLGLCLGLFVITTTRDELDVVVQQLLNTPGGTRIKWDELPTLALYAGLMLTPASISVLRWILYTSKMRPGIDRLFKDEERSP